MKQERGEFLGNYAPFGYQKDPDDHHKLLIDAEEAEIVRMIYDMFIGGMSATRIAKKMNELHIMTPGEFQIQRGAKSFITHTRNYPKAKMWCANTITTILKRALKRPKMNGLLWKGRTKQSYLMNCLPWRMNGLSEKHGQLRIKKTPIFFQVTSSVDIADIA